MEKRTMKQVKSDIDTMENKLNKYKDTSRVQYKAIKLKAVEILGYLTSECKQCGYDFFNKLDELKESNFNSLGL